MIPGTRVREISVLAAVVAACNDSIVGVPGDASSETTQGSASVAEDGSETGDGPGIAPPFRSGSRLRARYLDGGVGARELLAWFDTELGVECSFQFGPDGELRCMPGGAADHGSVYFADAACQVPILLADTCVPPEHLLVPVDPPSTCIGERPAYRPYRVQPRAEALATVHVVAGFGEGCIAVSGDGHQWHTLDALPLEELAVATIAVLPIDDTLGQEVLIADDGSSQWFAMHDMVIDRRCQALDVAGERRCVPTDEAIHTGAYFHDAGCATELVGAIDLEPQCAPPIVVRRSEDDAVFGVADEVVADEVFTGTGCDPLEPPQPPRRYFVAGDPLPADAMPALDEVGIGEGRAQLQHDTTADGIPLHSRGGWRDTELDTPCVPLRSENGDYVCAPWIGGGGRYFEDAACELELYIVKAEPEDTPTLITSLAWSTACGDVVWGGAHAVGEPYDAQVYDTFCHPSDGTDRPLYQLGADVPIGAFAILPVVTE